MRSATIPWAARSVIPMLWARSRKRASGLRCRQSMTWVWLERNRHVCLPSSLTYEIFACIFLREKLYCIPRDATSGGAEWTALSRSLRRRSRFVGHDRIPRSSSFRASTTSAQRLNSRRRSSLALDRCTQLIVDLSSAEFIDSSTITALVNAKKHADQVGCKFNLVLASTPIVERALEITGVLPGLNRVATVEQALAH